jgi:hypothetical protein
LNVVGLSAGNARLAGLEGKFPRKRILFPSAAVEGHMTKKDKIAFIKSSKRKAHVYNDLQRYTDQQLDELIREIVQGLVRESELIANAYMNGYR